MHKIKERTKNPSPTKFTDLFWPLIIKKDEPDLDEITKKKLLFPSSIKTAFRYICDHAKRN